MQVIYNIAEICAQKYVQDFILSPGSRCAPLTISLVRHSSIRTRTISDERSAAFIALGIAQQTKKTAGLVCTSGSAVYNYAPAVSEAFYQQIPLLILTADRPSEWIDQQDGQTIRQNGIYGAHVKKSYTLPSDQQHPDAKWEAERIVSEAINLAQEFPKGPVHINIPLREPLYPEKEIAFDKHVKVIERVEPVLSLAPSRLKELESAFNTYSRVLVVAGQTEYNPEIINALSSFSTHHNVPVVADVISNIPGEGIIHYHDTILSADDALTEALKPDLLITFGKSVISKNLKTFLRKSKVQEHWHLQPAGPVADTFQSLTKIIQVHPAYFFSNINIIPGKKSENYLQEWKHRETKARDYIWEYFNTEKPFTEFEAIYQVLQSLPADSMLHVANSMPVRYINYLTLSAAASGIELFANRGTSGIDGTISTAYGAALSTGKTVTVITGDMAFFYDRNAWWNQYPPANLRVVILNNHGGGIFRILEGPSRQPELDTYFETKQPLLAESMAKDFNLNYSLCDSAASLRLKLTAFFNKSDRPGILEVETDSKINTEGFRNFKRQISTLFEK